MNRSLLLAILAILAVPQVEARQEAPPVQILVQPARPEAAPERILIQPLGNYSQQDAALIQKAVTEFYGMPVVILPRIDLPKAAYTARFKRYRAEKLLSFLEKLPIDGYRIIGLTDSDISTTNGSIPDWGIIGLAVQPGKVCVISSYRCRMKTNDPALARTRLAKVAVHELGHTFDLDHCVTPNCLMMDAKGSVRTCDSEYDLCAHCRSLLQASGYAVASNPQVPWLLR